MEMPARHRLATCILAILLLGAPILRLSAKPLPATPPAATGMDAERLAELSKTIRENYRSIRAVVMLRRDLPVFEYYRHGTSPNDLLHVHSVTKSVMSILVGVALGQAVFNSLDQHLGDLLPEALEPGVDPRVREITIRDLLTMSSGFDPVSIGALPPSARLWAWSLHRPMLDAPGRQFNYDNGASHLLSVLLTRVIKQDPSRFARQHLFGPLGIENYAWLLDDEEDLQGASGLSLTARDMAKIGSLYLRGGRWNGMQLVPETYVTESTQQHNHGGSPGRAADYGYLWWITRPPGEAAAYFAAGYGGHLIYVVPARDLVIVIAGDASGAGGRRLINQTILPAVQMRPAP
jgi:CubicO group peptidase (beta-lactamase class C family)